MFVKNEPILDKKGRPMTKEQAEEELALLIDNFRIQFFFHRDDDSLMVDYEPDFRRLHAYDKFLMLKYECYTDWLKHSRKHIEKYPLEQIISDDRKKKISNKDINLKEKIIVDHLALNRVWQTELKSKRNSCKDELMRMGIVLPEWKSKAQKKKSKMTIKHKKAKMESIDKILCNCFPGKETGE